LAGREKNPKEACLGLLNMTTELTQQHDLGKSTLLNLYRQMLMIRSFEEQVLDLYARAIIPGIAHVSIGQEAVSTGVCSVLRTDDYITSTHRGHGHCLAKGARPEKMFAELFGKVEGYCRGKGGSMHIADPDTGNLGANAIVGGSLAIAAGAALSAKLRKSNQVVVCFFGDGALNQGLLLESMNMAGIWQLPVIYVCENNQYGEYTPVEAVTAGDVSRRGEAFGIRSITVDGMDVIKVYEAANLAVARARSSDGPSFLLCKTYRYFGHSMADRDRSYRTQEEEQAWRERDPIICFARYLTADGSAQQSELDAITEEVKRSILAAVDFGKAAPFPAAEEVTYHVYAD
jgi:TPP-dependent pyruvate/acetoin dehydrogenase alpha subunit